MTLAQRIEAVIAATEPLPFPRGDRLPIRAMGLEGVPSEDDAENQRLLRELDARGLALSARWDPADVEGSLAQALRLGRLQKQLGLDIGVDANACMHRFFNGDESTAHVNEAGEPFFDSSFGEQYKMGCPFALRDRYPVITAQFEPFLKAYRDAGLELAFIYLDWEIDGPVEWNGAWAASRACTRCREHLPGLEDFRAFQMALRTLRADMQREVYAAAVKAAFPNALIGNYAEYPGDGYRYWYDYFEVLPEGAPVKTDTRAQYREWPNLFSATGYTFAMPVVYTWYPTFGWYDFEDPDYRWFYNMLLVATNACKSTGGTVPIISWLHWHTTSPPPEPDPAVQQLSEEKYQELIWHMLLRGTDGLMNWCMDAETAKEIQLIQQVYAASLEYRDFLEGGTPIAFEVPTMPAPVVSALQLGERLLVRRTEFGGFEADVVLRRPGRPPVFVPAAPGECRIIEAR
ncbi:MAG: hypothetical protein FJX74_02525 [Armatimonadetes bacterium]|nr:hypothetical protein [Armatimonadota bacterium]